jgi:hypothetical protein
MRVTRSEQLLQHGSPAGQTFFQRARSEALTRAGTHLLGSAMSSSVTAQGSGGTHPCTACEKGAVLMSFSSSSTWRVERAMLTFSPFTGYFVRPPILMSSSTSVTGHCFAHHADSVHTTDAGTADAGVAANSTS